MTAPRRIQRKRERGWTKPEGAVYVGRGSRWGNPYTPGEAPANHTSPRRWAVEQYEDWITRSGMDVTPLAGRDLMCWCPEASACHADVLLRLANPELAEAAR